jgi:hypothetical protein
MGMSASTPLPLLITHYSFPSSTENRVMPDKIRAGSNQLVALLADAEPTALAETLTAFANADGGTLYVGVNEDGVPAGDVAPEDFDAAIQQAERLCRPDPWGSRWTSAARLVRGARGGRTVAATLAKGEFWRGRAR